MRNADKSARASHSDDSEGERFARMLDGLLAVPHAEVVVALEQDKATKAKKKVKASGARVASSRKR